MVKNHHLGKSIANAAWNTLYTFTSYKAEYPEERIIISRAATAPNIRLWIFLLENH
ncbi:hypothetical protein BMS3Bbin15_01480 [archaeon BMS3Bbin15]|nr:hypothetical protein BMS3Bbin15_01480 [archaeon BMS3Bbin15]